MAPNPRNPNWGGGGRGQGRKPNPNKPRKVAETKLNTRATAAPPVPAEPKGEVGPAIDPRAWAAMLPEIEEISRRYSMKKERTPESNPFRLPVFPKAAEPRDPKLLMAQDSALTANLGFASNQWLAGDDGGFSGEGFAFLGYTYLSELALRPEYRVMAETIADDATRKWIDFDVVGDEKTQQEERDKDPAGYDDRMADPDERKKRVGAAGKTDRVKELQDDQLRLAVRDRYYEQARNGGFFGRSHLFHDIRTNDAEDVNLEELKSPIGDGRSQLSKTKVPIGSFKGLKTIEPLWAYPLMYNASMPWKQDWYNPQVWYVNGQEFHGSRLLTFIPHPVPDMLKPAYAFGGLSLTQMAKPYVDRWITTVSSVNQLIHSFSVMVLATDLSTLMQPGNMAPLMARVAMFNMFRDNQGTFVINNKTEDFKNVSASLGGLHELQAQSQEHMCSVNRIPLVKFTGIQPAGLNASSEGEIDCYDDTIGAYQGRVLDSNLRTTINFEMLSLWGEVDPEITHRWEPLRPITQAEKGQKDKDTADTHQKYVDMGAIAPAEVRKIVVEDKELPYTNLNPDDLPEPPAEEGLLGPGAGAAASEFEREQSGQGDEPDKGGGASDAVLPFLAGDAEWNEGDHPRAPDGKFGSGGVSSERSGAPPHKAKPSEKLKAAAAKARVPQALHSAREAATAYTSADKKLKAVVKYIEQLHDKRDAIAEVDKPDDFGELNDAAGNDLEPGEKGADIDIVLEQARAASRGKVKDADLDVKLEPEEAREIPDTDKRDLEVITQRLKALYPLAKQRARDLAKATVGFKKSTAAAEARIDALVEDLDDIPMNEWEPWMMVAAALPNSSDPVEVSEYLDYLTGAYLSPDAAAAIDDTVDQVRSEAEWDAMPEEEQQAILEKQKQEAAEIDRKQTEQVHADVDAAMKAGWLPSYRDGRLYIHPSESPPEIAKYASPASMKKVIDRVAQHLMGEVEKG